MADDLSEGAAAVLMRDREKLIAATCRIVQSRAIAEEIVQDSWLRWTGQDYPAEKAQAIFWRIAKNLARDWYRRNRIETQILAAEAVARETAPDSERIFSARQDLQRVVNALMQLPDRTVTAFRMHRIDGLPYATIARELQMSPSTAFKLVEDAMVHIVLSLRP
ncbi:MAG: sigma-70 family RNA polymerase sigma factor [Pseudomonadota bacterium]